MAAPLGNERRKIVVVISGDASAQSNEKTLTFVREQLSTKFSNTTYNLFEDAKVNQDLLTLAEDEKLYDFSYLNKDLLVSVGKKYKFDYVVSLIFSLSSSYSDSEVTSPNSATDIILKVKVVDVNANQYLYSQDIISKGKFSMRSGSSNYNASITAGIKNCIDQLYKQIEIFH